MISEAKVRHLEMVQRIIERMSNCSFMLKGWTITLVIGIFTLMGIESVRKYFFIVFIPILVFWGLDAYYLKQERLYRCLYDRIRLNGIEETDFSLSISEEETCNKTCDFFCCFFSITLIAYYCSLAICAGIIIVVFN